MRTLVALLALSLPLCALAQLTPQVQAPANLPWPAESAGQPFAGPMGAFLTGPQLLAPAAATGPAPASQGFGTLGSPLTTTPGFMGLSPAASDAVTLGWGTSGGWGAAGTPTGWGAGASVWAPNPQPGATQPNALGADLSAARWSAAGLNPWMPIAQGSGAAPANPWTVTSASPWLSSPQSGAPSGAMGSAPTDSTGLGAVGWLVSPPAIAAGAQLPGNVGAGWTSPSAALSLGPAAALSPNPWIAVNPLEPLTPATGQTPANLGAAPSPWSPLPGATGLGGLQPQPAAPFSPFDPSAQFTTPGFSPFGGLQPSPWVTPAQPPVGGAFAAPQTGALGAPQAGPIWQPAPQAPAGSAAWGSANPVLTLDGQSWQVVAPSALPGGTPATTQSLMDQAREAGFQLVPIAPQSGVPGALEPPAPPAQ